MKGVAQTSFREGSILNSPPRLRLATPFLLNLRSRVRVASWNVLTLSDTGYQVALQLAMAAHNIYIACLSETPIPASGSHAVGTHSLIFSGGTLKQRGVAVMLSPTATRSMVSYRAISDRLLLVRLQHRHGFLTVISAYAPTEPSSVVDKDAFMTNSAVSYLRFRLTID